jgi:hypothetical protein
MQVEVWFMFCPGDAISYYHYHNLEIRAEKKGRPVGADFNAVDWMSNLTPNSAILLRHLVVLSCLTLQNTKNNKKKNSSPTSHFSRNEKEKRLNNITVNICSARWILYY